MSSRRILSARRLNLLASRETPFCTMYHAQQQRTTGGNE
ncbi:MAG: hypothetical protein K0S78_55 [Thermomicrobiales bacterium]|jgi:hypothetical protein|nr:hypothetical protein [Thermomicrobiales bacterium]MDF3040501.1 hypothetical protein [Thermomicrobiales bacterium]